MAPKCFDVCPDLCPMFDNLLSKFGGAPDEDAIQKKVCGAEKLFACAFEAGESACKPLLDAGAAFKAPTSRAGLSRRCGSKHHSMMLMSANMMLMSASSTASTQDVGVVASSAKALGGAGAITLLLLAALTLQHVV